MSKATVVGSLLIAVVATIAAVILLRPKQGTGITGVVTSVLTTDQVAAAVEIELEHPDGFHLSGSAWKRVVVSQDAFGTWWAAFEESLTESPRSLRWPVEETQVRAMLRVLGSTEVRSSQRERDDSEQFGDVYRLGIRVQGHGWIRYQLTSPRLGGVVYAINQEDRTHTSVWPSEVFDGLYAPGPVAWLNKHCFAGVGEADSIAIITNNEPMELQRSGSRWSMTKPVVSVVDATAMDALLKSIGTLSWETIQPGADKAPGWNDQIVDVEVRSSRKNQSGGATEEVVTLRTALADPSNSAVMRSRPATIRRMDRSKSSKPPEASVQLTVSSASISEILMTPAQLVSRMSVQHPAKDIGAIRVTTTDGLTAIFARTLDGWAFRSEAGVTTELSASFQSTVAELVRTLCETPVDSEAIQIIGDLHDYGMTGPFTSIEFLTLSDLSLGIVNIKLQPVASGPASLGVGGFIAVCQNHYVERTYPASTLDQYVRMLVDFVRTAQK
ncbi:MAG: hypothetical protein H6815_00015 [Phycisphaeraceae bacterium]|nr:hypothetical protein [Phycisphaerales bacterium]MCB9858813.1 hypothetical protein [Phycisphaeraceae bacterium]